LTALRGDGNHLSVIIGIYSRGPITADTIPNAESIFTTRVDPISPPSSEPCITVWNIRLAWFSWWRRRVPPPGPLRLFHATL